MSIGGSSFSCCFSSASSFQDFDLSNLEQLKDHTSANVRQLIFLMDGLISKLEKVEQRDEQGTEVTSSSSTAAFMEAGGKIVQMLSNRINWRNPKRCALAALNTHTIKLVSDTVTKLSTAPCVGIVASIVVFLSEQHEQFSSNKERRLRLLKHMSALAKRMNDLQDNEQREKFKDIFAYIVKATAICSMQMRPPPLCRFIFTCIDAGDLQNMEKELTDKYEDLKLEFLISIQDTVKSIKRNVPRVVSLSTKSYSPSAVDIQEAIDKVKRKLDLANPSKKVVAIYGFGGIGKTTLATQLVKVLDLSSYIYCRLDMDFASNNIPSLQAQLLRHAFGQNIVVDGYVNGQTILSYVFQQISKPLFLFIDNALRNDELERLLPIESLPCLPSKSRILVTTRNLNEVKVLSSSTDVSWEEHRVGHISDKQKAKRLLCHFAFGNPEYHVEDADVDGLLDICQGIPLLIRMVGRRLHASVVKKSKGIANTCSEITEFMSRVREKGWADRETDGIVDFVFTQLSEPSKEAFFDIIYFLNGWKRMKVAYVMGEALLEELEEAAFVTTEEEKVDVHDIIRERGMVLSAKFEDEYGIRIASVESWNRVKNDIQKFINIKGIRLDEKADNIENINNCSQIQMLMLIDDAIEQREFQLHLPESLQLLVLDGLDTNNLKVDQPRTSNLRLIKLAYINADWFLQSTSEFKRLVYLKITNCVKSDEVTEYSWHESPLKELVLDRLNSESLPAKTLVSLPCLERLIIKDCSGLKSLPHNFGNLRHLNVLKIRGCPLEKIPETFSNFTSLIYLHIDDCNELEEKALDTFLQIQSLFVLCMEGDPMLIKGWENIQWQRRPCPVLGGSLEMLEQNQIRCLFTGGGGSGFFRMKVDKEDLVWEDGDTCELMKDGGKICLVSTGIGHTISEKCREMLEAAIRDGCKIVYMDSGVSRWYRMCHAGDKVAWNDEDKELMKKVLSQLPHGCTCCVWTSPFPKNCLIFLWLVFLKSFNSIQSLESLESKETFIIKGTMEEEKITSKVMMSKELNFEYGEDVVEKSKMEEVVVRAIGTTPFGFHLLHQGLTQSLIRFFMHLLMN